MASNYGDLSFVKEVLGITDTSKDAFLTTILEQATEVFKTLIDRDLDLNEYTEFIAGSNEQYLNVLNYPVIEILEVKRIISPELSEIEDLTTEVVAQQNNQDLQAGTIFKDDFWNETDYGVTLLATRGLPKSRNFKIKYKAGYDPIPSDIMWYINNFAIDQFKAYEFSNVGGVTTLTQGTLTYKFSDSLTSKEGMALIQRYERKSYEF